MDIRIPNNRTEATNLVVDALIARNNKRIFAEGHNTVYLKALRQLFEKSPLAEKLLADFVNIVKDGAKIFATLGFVPVEAYDVTSEELIIVVEYSSSTK